MILMIFILILDQIINNMIPKPSSEYKLVLVGDSAVGKSSLLCQFVERTFDDKLLSTIGVDFKFRRVTIDKQEIKLQIWDTAGQQTFRSIVSAYYNSADAILICYDISNYQTFQSVKNYWLEQAQNNNKTNAKVFVVGNKLDCKREVQSFSIDSIRDKGVHAFFEVSAKQNTNVEKCFLEITKLVHADKHKKEQIAVQYRSQKIKAPPTTTRTASIQPIPPKKSCCQ